MKKFFTVFKYEFLTHIKNKTFLFTTLFFVAAALVGSFFIVRELQSDQPIIDMDVDYSEEEAYFEPVYVFVSDEHKEYISHLEDYKSHKITYYENEELLRQDVLEDDTVGLIVSNYNDYEIIIVGTSIFESSNLEYFLQDMYESKLLLDSGLSLDEVVKFKTDNIKIEYNNLGVDGVLGYGYSYVFSFILYMMVLMFGSVVSSSVIVEKTSKAMELLITSTSATSLVTGKVIAIGLSCILQILTIISAFLIGFKAFSFNKEVLNIFELIGGIPWDVILLALFLFVVGFFSILFLFAGFSSFASKPEDANAVVSPLVIVILIAFILNTSASATSLFEKPFFIGLSYVPILSPFLLFSRYTLYGLSSVELLIGLSTNLLGAIVLIIFAAKIYRLGTLYYGNKINLWIIFKSFKNK